MDLATLYALMQAGSFQQGQTSDQKNPMGSYALTQGGMTALNALISGLMSGAGIKQERKYKEKKLEELLGKLKPGGTYYQTPYLAGYDKVLANAIMGNLAQKFGGKFGIDFTDIFSMIEQGRTPSQGTQRWNLRPSAMPQGASYTGR